MTRKQLVDYYLDRQSGFTVAPAVQYCSLEGVQFLLSNVSCNGGMSGASMVMVMVMVMVDMCVFMYRFYCIFAEHSLSCCTTDLQG